jgi:hypothetical protein
MEDEESDWLLAKVQVGFVHTRNSYSQFVTREVDLTVLGEFETGRIPGNRRVNSPRWVQRRRVSYDTAYAKLSRIYFDI